MCGRRTGSSFLPVAFGSKSNSHQRWSGSSWKPWRECAGCSCPATIQDRGGCSRNALDAAFDGHVGTENQSAIYQRRVQLEKRVDPGRVSSHPALITSSRAARAGARGLSGVTGTQAIPISSACWPPSSKRTDSEGLTPCASNHE